MSDDQRLVELVTRGLAGIQEQLRERDGRVSHLSDKMIGVEFRLEQLHGAVMEIRAVQKQADLERLTMRVEALEEDVRTNKNHQRENVKWIKGIVGSIILLLIGFLFNFIRISAR